MITLSLLKFNSACFSNKVCGPYMYCKKTILGILGHCKIKKHDLDLSQQVENVNEENGYQATSLISAFFVGLVIGFVAFKFASSNKNAKDTSYELQENVCLTKA